MIKSMRVDWIEIERGQIWLDMLSASGIFMGKEQYLRGNVFNMLFEMN